MANFRPFETYELMPLEVYQAVAYMEKSIQDTRLLSVLKEGLQNDELKIRMTPMSLELLLEVVTIEQEIPASLAEVFERYCDIVCGKYEKAKGIEVIFEYQIKSRFLSELAWSEFYSKAQLEIPKASLDSFLKGYGSLHGWDTNKLNRFVNEISRAGLLNIGETVSFSHRSFLEFFIALRMHQRKTEYPSIDNFLVKLHFDEMWTEVAFYYFGIERELSVAAITLISQWPENNFDDCVNKIMIGRLLQAGWYTPSSEKIRGIEIGLLSAQKAREIVDNMLSKSEYRLPRIFSDFFALATCEYSFGSRTLLPETYKIYEQLSTNINPVAVRNSLLLMWAQRSRLTEKDKNDFSKLVLSCLANMEKSGQLEIREKFVSLFILEQFEREDKNLLASIRRKLNRTKEVYKDEMKLLLPHSKKGKIRFSVAKRKGLRIDELY